MRYWIVGSYHCSTALNHEQNPYYIVTFKSMIKSHQQKIHENKNVHTKSTEELKI